MVPMSTCRAAKETQRKNRILTQREKARVERHERTALTQGHWLRKIDIHSSPDEHLAVSIS